LHTLPSEHVVPFATTGFWQTPTLQTSLVHGFESLQSAATLHGWQPAIGVWMQPLSASQESVVHAFPSLQLSGVPVVQRPLWQVSLPLHTVLSAQDVPLGTATCWQPTSALHESVVQGFWSSQTSGVPAVHEPAWQVSEPLQTLPSRHGVPFGTGVWAQPVTELQVSAVHGLPSSQLTHVPGTQTPARQVSAPLQTFVSAHDVPSNAGVCWQPVCALQVSVVQTLPSSQLSCVPGLQTPFWQVSVPLQTVLSAHDVPFTTGVCWQPRTGSQLSAVHGFASTQLSAAPPVQTPFWHVSAPLHTVASGQGSPFATFACWQPATGSQVSVVQGFWSSHTSAVPGVHTPPWQVSAPLHTVPSAQEVPFGTVVF